MNTNSTEIKNETENQIINPDPQQVGTGDPPVTTGNLPGAGACEAPQPLTPTHLLTHSPAHSLPPQFIKTPEVYSRQGELLTPEHPDYAGILAIITRELSERFQNGDFTLAHYFAPQGGTGDPPVTAGHLPGAAPSSSDLAPAPLAYAHAHAPAPAPAFETEADPSSPPLNPVSNQSETCEAAQPISPLKVSSSPSLTVSNAPPLLFPPNKRPRTGKVAQLPDDVRDSVSQQMYDEVPYKEILRGLSEQGFHDFNKTNLTSWKVGGLRDWLHQQQQRIRSEARQDEILRAVRSNCTLEDTALALAINQVFEVLDDFDVKLLQVRLAEKPQMYPVVVQALLKLVKARKASKNCPPLNRSVKPSPNDPDFVLPEAERGLSDETIKKMIDALNLL
jgi:hypothetical protein